MLCAERDRIVTVKEEKEHQDESLETNADAGTSASSTENVKLQSLMQYDEGRSLYVCIICNREFKYLQVMRCHLHCHTSDLFTYSCEVCQQTFTQLLQLQVHKCARLAEKPYSCPMCSKTFASAFLLRRHIRVHVWKRPVSSSSAGKFRAVHVDEKTVNFEK